MTTKRRERQAIAPTTKFFAQYAVVCIFLSFALISRSKTFFERRLHWCAVCVLVRADAFVCLIACVVHVCVGCRPSFVVR